MPNDREYVERTTVRETPVTERSSAAGWWIAAIVAIIAVAGLLFVFGNQNSQDELQAARIRENFAIVSALERHGHH